MAVWSHQKEVIAGILLVQLFWCCRAQQYGLSASIANLQAQAQTTYNWTVTNTVDKPVISVQVGDNNGFATVQYTVSYNRNRNQQETYVLTGNINVQDTDGAAHVIALPVVTVLTGRRATVKLPSRSISCPSLTVPANGQVSCTFTASYTGEQPLPGFVSATVTLATTNNVITTPTLPYDFTGAQLTEAGGLATISSYFEQGQNLLQPYGVSGSQPPPGLSISDDTTYTFTAYYGNVAASNCGQQQWQAINTAAVKPTASSTSSSRRNSTLLTAASLVTINLVGCDTASGGSGPAFSSTTDGSGTTAPAAAPPAAPPAAAAPSPTPTATRRPAPPGVTFAEAGSILCGNGVCPPNQRCFDGFNCCDNAIDICGGVCCDAGRVCLSNQCVAAGSTLCGTSVCAAGDICTDGVCCPSTQKVCNGVCCTAGQDCILGQCASLGSTACGGSVCSPTQQCVGGAVCCNTGETACAGRCCGVGNTCLGNQFCVPVGSTLCGGTVCPASQQCAGGALCCNLGATFCAGSCCPSGSTCQGNQCLAPGTTLCGTNVCTSSQTCQGGSVCCDQGATFCGTGCCAQGNVCVNNQCVPTGSSACGATVICTIGQFCGNPTTGICCQSNTQIGCFSTCCQSPEQICNQFTQQCSSRINTACAAGTVWCPSANVCCPVGQLCYLGQCVASNAVPGGGIVTPAFGRKLAKLQGL